MNNSGVISVISPSLLSRIYPRRKYTLNDLAKSYVSHCLLYYRRPDGTKTKTITRIRRVLRIITKEHGKLDPSRFTPLMLREFQEALISRNLARNSINNYTDVVKQFFKWGVSRERVHPLTHHALTTVPNLKYGRSGARETERIQPVSEEDIMAIKDTVSAVYWNLIRLQLATGARGGEIIKLRGCDIKQQGEVWRAELTDHKNSWREQSRVLFFGPRAQAILNPILMFLLPQEYIFSPDAGLRPHQTQSYRQAIHRACKKAGIPKWSPHQLRHTSGTLVREQFGVEAAQVHLGHASMNATQIYAERDEKLAQKIAKEIG